MVEVTSKNIRIWSRLGPSGAFGMAALELAEQNQNVVMLTSDLCFFSGLERFKKEYPERLYNFGIAEQNMVGAAGGMAKEGLIPFANTYASFAASRCMDQVRVNMSYMKLPIKLVGLTAGFGAGILGATHISVEDIAVMRAVPGITVISPADCTEIVKTVLAAAEFDEPVYIRLTGPMNTPIVYKEDYDFQIGKAVEIQSGMDIGIIATGSMVHEALEAVKILEEQELSCSVINMHTIKPLDIEMVARMSDTHKILVTVEEHSILGGLGGAVAEYISQQQTHPPLLKIGIEDQFPHAGEYRYQLEQSGLAAPQIAHKILNKYKEIK